MELVGLLAIAAFGYFSYRRLLSYLHILQQDDYNNKRFISWLISSKSFDKYLSLVLVLLAVVFYTAGFKTEATAAAAIVFLGFAFIQNDPTKKAKKKLVLTQRAKRILYTGLALTTVSPVTWLTLHSFWLWVVAVQLIPLLLCVGNWLLRPYEAKIQQGFRQQAVDRLNQVSPTVVAVTGSYGKTSVKHMMGHVLGLNAKAVVTPGSVNTDMGVARILREDLRDDTEFFVTEMGAYGVGSIARLCRFTPPHIGIITAIGPAHLERFGSLENTAKAKFELAAAVLEKPEGRMILHENVMQYGNAFDFIAENSDRLVIVGEGPASHVRIDSRLQTKEGMEIQVAWSGATYSLRAPLYGFHHGDNMATAFAVAVTCGIDPDKVVTALRSAPQIKHRLEVKKQPGSATYIDDAFNSNPKGFVAALELMALLAEGEGRAVLVTPGVVELGDEHDIVHAELGHEAAKNADVVLVVNPSRIPSFRQAIDAVGETEVHEFETFAEASDWLVANTIGGDVVLLENDLPDLFNDTLNI